MNYKLKHTKPVVLSFVLLPILILIVVVIAIAIRQSLFVKKIAYSTSLQNATGVSTQTPILYKGFEIGRVKSFKLSDKGNIRIEFYILQTYQNSVADPSVILRQTNPVTSRTILELVPDLQSGRILKEGSYLPSTDFADGKALLRKINPTITDPISGIIEDVAKLTNELNEDDNPEAGAIFRIIYNAANATEKVDAALIEMQAIMQELQVFLTNLNKDNTADEGTVFRILNDVASIVEGVESQTEQIESLIESASVAARNYSDPDSLVIRMIDPDGSKIIRPLSNLLITTNASLREAQSLLQLANRNNPELIMLINNLNETMNQASQTLEALNNHPILRGGISTTQPKASTGSLRMSDLPNE